MTSRRCARSKRSCARRRSSAYTKLATAKLTESFELPETSQVNALRLAYADGQLAWPIDEGVAFGKL